MRHSCYSCLYSEDYCVHVSAAEDCVSTMLRTYHAGIELDKEAIANFENK